MPDVDCPHQIQLETIHTLLVCVGLNCGKRLGQQVASATTGEEFLDFPPVELLVVGCVDWTKSLRLWLWVKRRPFKLTGRYGNDMEMTWK